MDLQHIEISALVDFEMLVNTDYGVIQLMKRDYSNGDFIDLDYLNTVPDYALLGELYNRDYENPLLMILKDEYKDQADSLYEQILEEKYKDVLELSITTNVKALMTMYIKNDQMPVTVLCKNIHEQHFINKLNEGYQITLEPRTKLNTDLYDFYYIKKFKDVLDFKGIQVKNLYIARYGFNLEKGYNNILNLSICDNVAQFNQVLFIDLYPMLEIKG